MRTISHVVVCSFVLLSVSGTSPSSRAEGIFEANKESTVVQKAEPVLLGNGNFSQIRKAPMRNYRLVEEINLADHQPWTPIYSFTGQLDGAGHTLYGLRINETIDNVNSGLFRKASNAVIANLVFSDFRLDSRGKKTNTGVIAGTCERCNVTNVICSDGVMSVSGGDNMSNHFSTLGTLFGIAVDSHALFIANNVKMEGDRNCVIGGGIGFANACTLDGSLSNISQTADSAQLGLGVGHTDNNSRIRVTARNVTQLGEKIIAGIGVGDNRSGSSVRVVVNQAVQRGSGRFGAGTGNTDHGADVRVAALNLNQTATGFQSTIGVGSGDARNAGVFSVGSNIQQKIVGEGSALGGGSGHGVNAKIQSFLHRASQTHEGVNIGAGSIGGGLGMILRSCHEGQHCNNGDSSQIRCIVSEVTQTGAARSTLGGGAGSILVQSDSSTVLEALVSGLTQAQGEWGYAGAVVGYGDGPNSTMMAVAFGDNQFGDNTQGGEVESLPEDEVRRRSAVNLGFSGPWISGDDKQLPMLAGLDGIYQDLVRLSESFAEVALEHVSPGNMQNSVMPEQHWNIQVGRLPFPKRMDPCLVKHSGTLCADGGFACYTDDIEPTNCPGDSNVTHLYDSKRLAWRTPSPDLAPDGELCRPIQGKPLFHTFDQRFDHIYVVSFQADIEELALSRYTNDGTLDGRFGLCGTRRWQSLDLPPNFNVTASSVKLTDDTVLMTLMVGGEKHTKSVHLLVNQSSALIRVAPVDPTWDDMQVRGLTAVGDLLYYSGSSGDRMLFFWVGDTSGYFWLNTPGDAYATQKHREHLYITGQQRDNLLILKFDQSHSELDTTFGNRGSITKAFFSPARGNALLVDRDRVLVAGNLDSEGKNLFLLAYSLDGNRVKGFPVILEKTPINDLDATTAIIRGNDHLYLIKYHRASNKLALFTYNLQGKKINETVHSGDFSDISEQSLSVDRSVGKLWLAVKDSAGYVSVHGFDLPLWNQP